MNESPSISQAFVKSEEARQAVAAFTASDALILGLDSSGKSMSVALCRGSKVLSEDYFDIGLTHSQTFLPAIERLLKACGVSYRDLDLIAVCCGPGSFTGIRIGIATAKTIAFSLSIPLIGINALRALAEPYRELGLFSVPSIDARGGRLYAAIYGPNTALMEPMQVQAASLVGELSRLHNIMKADAASQLILPGDGATVLLQQFENEEAESQLCARIPQGRNGVSAAVVARLGLTDYLDGRVDGNIDSVDADYCALSQAERLSPRG